jgi:hypothetical protein
MDAAMGKHWQNWKDVPMQIVNERIMRMRLSNHIPTAYLLPIICMVLIAFMSLRLSMPATAEAQKDTNACLRTSNALYKRGGGVVQETTLAISSRISPRCF